MTRWTAALKLRQDLAEMMQERGVTIDPSTIFRWAQRYAPEIERQIRLYRCLDISGINLPTFTFEARA
jgi:transposase-like protein